MRSTATVVPLTSAAVIANASGLSSGTHCVTQSLRPMVTPVKFLVSIATDNSPQNSLLSSSWGRAVRQGYLPKRSWRTGYAGFAHALRLKLATATVQQLATL